MVLTYVRLDRNCLIDIGLYMFLYLYSLFCGENWDTSDESRKSVIRIYYATFRSKFLTQVYVSFLGSTADFWSVLHKVHLGSLKVWYFTYHLSVVPLKPCMIFGF